MKKPYTFLSALAVLSLLLFSLRPSKEKPPNPDLNKDYGPGDVVTRFLVAEDGTLWLTTTEEGIFKFDGQSFTQYTIEHGLCGNEVWDIIQDNDGIIWLATGNGLCRFEKDRFETIPIPKSEVKTEWLKSVYPVVNPNGVMSLAVAQDGAIWVGSNGAGVYRYKEGNFTPYLQDKGKLMPDTLHHNVITRVVEDHQGSIWVGSFSHGGLSKYDGSSFIDYPLWDGIGNGMISTIYRDSDEHLWIGTRNSGIHRFDGKEFIQVNESATDAPIPMATFLEDSKGTIWVASYARKGIFNLGNEGFHTIDIPNIEKLIDIKSMVEDSAGNIWFGGRYGILWRYDGKELKDFTHLKTSE